MKGLRQYGKNFFKIRKELLPHRETVSYYSLITLDVVVVVICVFHPGTLTLVACTNSFDGFVGMSVSERVCLRVCVCTIVCVDVLWCTWAPWTHEESKVCMCTSSVLIYFQFFFKITDIFLINVCSVLAVKERTILLKPVFATAVTYFTNLCTLLLLLNWILIFLFTVKMKHTIFCISFL